MILFPAKTEIVFQEAIILVILIKIDLHLLKVELIFLPEILLSPCVDSIIKGIKKLVLLRLMQLLRLFRALQTSRVLNISTYAR